MVIFLTLFIDLYGLWGKYTMKTTIQMQQQQKKKNIPYAY